MNRSVPRKLTYVFNRKNAWKIATVTVEQKKLKEAEKTGIEYKNEDERMVLECEKEKRS